MQMKLGKTIGFAVLIWVIGFVWGTVVFMTPALKDIPSIPMFSRYPAITFPLLPLFPWLAYVFAKKCVEVKARSIENVPPVGFVFAGVNALLDILVLVLAFKSGWEYFYFLSIWIAYALLVLAAQASLKKMATAA